MCFRRKKARERKREHDLQARTTTIIGFLEPEDDFLEARELEEGVVSAGDLVESCSSCGAGSLGVLGRSADDAGIGEDRERLVDRVAPAQIPTTMP